MNQSFKYYYLYKPFGFLCQFTKEMPHHKTLGDLYKFPGNVYPIGRLDKDSEGLLILTNDTSLNSKLLSPSLGHVRTYFVQVEGIPKPEELASLQPGIEIRVSKKIVKTKPCSAIFATNTEWIEERNPSIRVRKNIPDCWIEMKLTEGKNRQVRKMLASIGYPVLRLVRSSIELLDVKNLSPGQVREIDRTALWRHLQIAD